MEFGLTNGDLQALLSKYVTTAAPITEEEHSMNVINFDVYLSELDKQIRRMVARSQRPVTIDGEERCTARVAPQVRQLKQWTSDLTAALFAMQLAGLRRLAFIAAQIRAHVAAHPAAIGRVNALNADLRHDLVSAARYLSLRRRRKRFIKKAAHILAHPGHSVPLRSALTEAVARYDAAVVFCPPGALDTELEAYIAKTPALAGSLFPIAQLIVDANVACILDAIGDFNLAVMRSLGLHGESVRAVLYVTVVRILFAKAYTLDAAPLCGDNAECAEFLAVAQRFSEQTVRDFVESPGIVKKFTPGLPLTSMFKARQLQLLKPMEFMTSPIDLMYFVHTILQTLANQFGAELDQAMLSFDDTLTLLSALLSIGPPSNAVRIAAFVVEWEAVMISDVLPIARNYFVAAVEQISLFGERMRDAEAARAPGSPGPVFAQSPPS
jgi:hypothetical protein